MPMDATVAKIDALSSNLEANKQGFIIGGCIVSIILLLATFLICCCCRVRNSSKRGKKVTSRVSQPKSAASQQSRLAPNFVINTSLDADKTQFEEQKMEETKVLSRPMEEGDLSHSMLTSAEKKRVHFCLGQVATREEYFESGKATNTPNVRDYYANFGGPPVYSSKKPNADD